MNITIVIAIVMVSTIGFLFLALDSSYRSILLPIKIPVKYDFESTHVIDPIAGNSLNHDTGYNAYAIVLSKADGQELLRLKPEEARDILKIVHHDNAGAAYLIWSSLPNTLEFHKDTGRQSFKPVKVILTGSFTTNSKAATNMEVLGTEGDLEGLVEIGEEEGISFSNFSWSFNGNTIPIAEGKADTGKWLLTTYRETPSRITIDHATQKITVKHVSFFTSENLFAEDSVTGQRLPIAFETTVTGSISPSASQLQSYILSQIYLQVFGWLIPVSILMAILWVDNRYRVRIQRELKSHQISND